MNEPKLRFKADDGSEFPEWEEHNFGDLYKVCSGYAFKYENYCDSGVALVNGQAIQHGWIDDNNMNYLPETFLQQYKDFVLKENDIVLGLNRPITNGKLKIARVPKEYNNSLLYQRAGKIVCKKAVDDDFSYALLAREIFKFTIKEAAGSDQPFISTSKLNNWKIIVPSSEQEQQKIADFLSTIDTVIAKQKETVSAWEERKKGVMQKLFSQEVRFKADDGSDFPDWEEKKIDDLFYKVNERNNGQFGKDKWISVAKMYYQDEDKVTSNNIDTRTYVMRVGDMSFEGHPNKEFKYGRFVVNDIGDGIISELFPIYRHKENYILKYWKYAIQVDSIMQKIYRKSITSSGASSNKLDDDDFKRQSISVPCLEEQQKIADCLSSLDEVIEKQKATLAAWEALKKGLLQQMFV